MGRSRIGAPWGVKRAVGALLGGFLLAQPALAQRLAYLPLPIDNQVTQGPVLAYRALPIDDRIAPDDFAADDDATEPLTPNQVAQVRARLAEINADQDYVPRPALWKIADKDTTIYLFGTIHVLPPGFRWRTPLLERIAKQADTLIVESVDDANDIEGLMSTGPSGKKIAPLSARVSPDHRDKLAEFMGTLPPQAAEILDGLPTWIASVAVSFVREVRAGEVPGPGADSWLEDQFRTAGKTILPIEDSSKVLSGANAIPDKEQRAMLDAALDAPPVDRAKLRAPTHAWAKGEVGDGSILRVNMAALGSSSLSRPLLDNRNRAWAASLAKRLAMPGTVLFAAGVGHFIGKDSVIALLERRGIKVTRVE